jgi:hypothetical protein
MEGTIHFVINFKLKQIVHQMLLIDVEFCHIDAVFEDRLVGSMRDLWSCLCSPLFSVGVTAISGGKYGETVGVAF